MNNPRLGSIIHLQDRHTVPIASEYTDRLFWKSYFAMTTTQ